MLSMTRGGWAREGLSEEVKLCQPAQAFCSLETTEWTRRNLQISTNCTVMPALRFNSSMSPGEPSKSRLSLHTAEALETAPLVLAFRRLSNAEDRRPLLASPIYLHPPTIWEDSRWQEHGSGAPSTIGNA